MTEIMVQGLVWGIRPGICVVCGKLAASCLIQGTEPGDVAMQLEAMGLRSVFFSLRWSELSFQSPSLWCRAQGLIAFQMQLSLRQLSRD